MAKTTSTELLPKCINHSSLQACEHHQSLKVIKVTTQLLSDPQGDAE